MKKFELQKQFVPNKDLYKVIEKKPNRISKHFEKKLVTNVIISQVQESINESINALKQSEKNPLLLSENLLESIIKKQIRQPV